MDQARVLFGQHLSGTEDFRILDLETLTVHPMIEQKPCIDEADMVLEKVAIIPIRKGDELSEISLLEYKKRGASPVSDLIRRDDFAFSLEYKKRGTSRYSIRAGDSGKEQPMGYEKRLDNIPLHTNAITELQRKFIETEIRSLNSECDVESLKTRIRVLENIERGRIGSP